MKRTRESDRRYLPFLFSPSKLLKQIIEKDQAKIKVVKDLLTIRARLSQDSFLEFRDQVKVLQQAIALDDDQLKRIFNNGRRYSKRDPSYRDKILSEIENSQQQQEEEVPAKKLKKNNENILKRKRQEEEQAQNEIEREHLTTETQDALASQHEMAIEDRDSQMLQLQDEANLLSHIEDTISRAVVDKVDELAKKLANARSKKKREERIQKLKAIRLQNRKPTFILPTDDETFDLEGSEQVEPPTTQIDPEEIHDMSEMQDEQQGPFSDLDPSFDQVVGTEEEDLPTYEEMTQQEEGLPSFEDMQGNVPQQNKEDDENLIEEEDAYKDPIVVVDTAQVENLEPTVVDLPQGTDENSTDQGQVQKQQQEEPPMVTQDHLEHAIEQNDQGRSEEHTSELQ